MTRQSQPPQLDLLYAAVVRQSEDDVMAAVRYLYPHLSPQQEEAILSKYRQTCRMAEQRVISKAEQGD